MYILYDLNILLLYHAFPTWMFQSTFLPDISTISSSRVHAEIIQVKESNKFKLNNFNSSRHFLHHFYRPK